MDWSGYTSMYFRNIKQDKSKIYNICNWISEMNDITLKVYGKVQKKI